MPGIWHTHFEMMRMWSNFVAATAKNFTWVETRCDSWKLLLRSHSIGRRLKMKRTARQIQYCSMLWRHENLNRPKFCLRSLRKLESEFRGNISEAVFFGFDNRWAEVLRNPLASVYGTMWLSASGRRRRTPACRAGRSNGLLWDPILC